MKINLEASWLAELATEFEQTYMQSLKAFLLQEKNTGQQVYPKGDEMFNAFNFTPLSAVKVVILGQDPYHGAGQAHGLSFSVKRGVAVPPSLKNIYKELSNEFTEFTTPTHGDLSNWAHQGVLLLNATLSVRANSPGSHQKRGWEQFTDMVIQVLSAKKENLVFILWGNYAKQKESLIDTTKHLIIKSAHPSPFSAHQGFLGSKPFSTCNTYLSKKGIQAIDWCKL